MPGLITRIAAALIVVVAVAAPAAAGPRDEAKAMFQEGVAHYKAGRYEEAAGAFREANRIHPTWKLQFNIGQCEAALRRYGLAFEAFETYLLEGGDDVSDERQREVRDELARLRDLSGELEVSGPAGATVLVDGSERGTLPLDGRLRVAGGRREVRVVLASDTLLERRIKLSGRGLVLLEARAREPGVATPSLETEESTPILPEEIEEDDEPAGALVTWGWVVTGTGAAAAIAGAITGGLALSANGELEDSCPDGCFEGDHDALERRNNLALATDVLIGVGAAAVVAGTVMLIVGYGRESDEEELAVRPVLGPDGGGALLEWRF